MIAMDSTPAACIAAPEWFWFWFGLLVLVNIATEIALTTIAAAIRHLLVLVTSSGHHSSFSAYSSFVSLSVFGYFLYNKFGNLAAYYTIGVEIKISGKSFIA